jgi:peptidoglycan/LPS O-acetylase OafA/YrhL
MLACCQNDTWLTRVLSSRFAIFSGTISYSVYIWSWSALTVLHDQYISDAASPLAYFNSAVKLITYIFLTAVFAYGSYLLIEEPSRRWLRYWLVKPTVNGQIVIEETNVMAHAPSQS